MYSNDFFNKDAGCIILWDTMRSGKTQHFVLLEMTPCDGQINVRQIGNKLVCVPRPGRG